MKQSANLLVSLSKWASGQQENFLSDAFVHLMNVLAHDSPEAFAMIIESMSDGTIRPAGDSAEAFTLISQVNLSEGTPDIEIVGPDSYALVEVKDESPVDVDQVERYMKLVKESEAGSKCLVLLTRYQPPALPDSPLLKPVRWTQITEWLRSAEEGFNFDETSIYALRQFIGFLEAKGMSVNKESRLGNASGHWTVCELQGPAPAGDGIRRCSQGLRRLWCRFQRLGHPGHLDGKRSLLRLPTVWRTREAALHLQCSICA